ncbi:MAG TPA: hypothetical protein PKH40_12020, partial [Treponemataceae bacterium]|nr:hypothetical protein [Treponemataceae bacterium]
MELEVNMIQKILLFLLSVTSALYAQSVTTSNEYPFFPTNQSVYANRNYSSRFQKSVTFEIGFWKKPQVFIIERLV